MSKAYPKLELVGNILFILVSVLLIGIIIQKYFFSASPERKTPVIGKKISLPSIDWSKTDKNVLLVLSKGCVFCTESAGFYKRLIETAKNEKVNVVAVLPQEKEEGKKYVNDLGIQGIEVLQSELDSLDVSGTPTVIILNDKGEVSDFWVGKLPSEKESEVLTKLK